MAKKKTPNSGSFFELERLLYCFGAGVVGAGRGVVGRGVGADGVPAAGVGGAGTPDFWL